jgi:competence protein ComEA
MISLKRLKIFLGKTFGFTPQERLIIYILGAALVIGIFLVVYFRSTSPGFMQPAFDYSILDSTFSAKSNPALSDSTPKTASEAFLLQQINTMTPTDFDALPGIGPVISQHIIQFRNEHNGFIKFDNLLAVTGIGPKRLEVIRKSLMENYKK